MAKTFADTPLLRNDEKAQFTLRELYQRYGYTRFKMSKFEEYELYARNKDFLVDDSILTFTDTNGKLMALKPDVTLSIIKNSRDGKNDLQKVYYNETVYRRSGSTRTFREILQTGLECIGDVDLYDICEVICLAIRSLSSIHDAYVLDISHMGFLRGVLSACGVCETDAPCVLSYIAEKNAHELRAFCEARSFGKDKTETLLSLVTTCGSFDAAVDRLDALVPNGNESAAAAAKELREIRTLLRAQGLVDRVNLDFSVTGDMNYYNGVMFKGFLEGIPGSVLSGGQYDHLVRKMGRNAGAVGFAVYLDALERMDEPQKDCDVDCVVLYDEKTDVASVAKAVAELTDRGMSVTALHKLPENLRYQQLIRLDEKRGADV